MNEAQAKTINHDRLIVRWPRPQGITFFEVLCVVTVVGIVAIYSSHAVTPGFVSAWHARQASQELDSTFTQARSLAIAKNAETQVIFTRSGARVRSYRIVQSGKDVDAVHVPDDVQMRSSNRAITFEIDGCPDRETDVRVRVGPEWRTIRVDGVTGLSSIEQ